MASSVYSEVTSVSTYGFEQDRVLDKLKVASTSLPYTVDDVTISHNDFAISDVYNNSLTKLYKNYLYLIANAELLTKSPPTSAAPNYLSINDSMAGSLVAVTTDPKDGTGTNYLSSLQETHITLKNDGTEKFLYFNYSSDESVISETDVNLTTITTLVSGNEVEFNKTFKFKNVVSVDIVDNLLFVLDKDSNTAFKFDITGLITDDVALKRTGVNDTAHPGRYLLKTIGGEGTSQTKNKLVRPSSLSVYKNRVYILDNGHNSIKVFDLDFNFIREVNAPSLFNNSNTGELVSIVVDQYSDTNESVFGYILSSNGKIIEYDVVDNTLSQPQALFNFYDTRLYTLSGLNESGNFKKIVNSKAVKNILYICNNGKIYKYYKSNLNQYLGVLNLSAGATSTGLRISGNDDDQQILSFDTALYNNKDYVAVTTVVNSNQKVSTYVYEDEHVTTKLYSENLYTNYFTLSDILVLPQEIVNNITFNKTTKKLIYNHYSLFENLNKKVYSFYNTNEGYASVPTLCTVNYHEFTKPSALDDSNNLYIGVNEPLLADVINRPLKLLYSQQESLFNLIKEEPLNNNPPDNIAIRLPANTESYPNVLKVESAASTVSAGDFITMKVTRTNVLTALPSCSFKFYTTLGTATSADFTYISSDDKDIEVFNKDETEKEIYIDTLQFFTGADKTFNFIIEENTNCVIDSNLSTVTGTITGIGDMYTISMSAATLSVNEGSTGRVAITRTVTDTPTGLPDIDVESSVNLVITEDTVATAGSYTPVVTGSNDKNVVVTRYEDFPGTGVTQQTSAAQIDNTSTIFFTGNVSSVVFDISAVNDLSESTSKSLTLVIDNPSAGSAMGSILEQKISLNQEYKTTSLFLSAISASYLTDTTNMLSCVNIWEALSGSTAESNTTAFSTFSATNPYIVNFTVNTPLSVFSVSTVSAALQFDPPTDSMVYNSNQLNVIVEGVGGNIGDVSALLMGKGGDGGHGALWLSGSDFDPGAATDPVSASYFIGQDGGPAIDGSSYFSTVSVNNSGFVYGGAGGGGGGVLGLSAQIDSFVHFLSAGSGGGGGSGIHVANYGAGGLAGVKYFEDSADVQTANFRHVFVNNGAVGTYGNAGLGGTYSSSSNSTNTYPTIAGTGTTITDHLQMSGLSGGSYGLPGQGDGVYYYPLDGSNTHATLPAAGSYEIGVPNNYKQRAGGAAGDIAKLRRSTSTTQVITAGDGAYAGTVS